MSARREHRTVSSHFGQIRNAYHRRTHRSAPTAGGKNGWKVPDAFCPLSAKNWVKRCILWQRRSTCSRTVLVSLRRGGPMCPPVVGNTNSPKNGREPYGVSAGRTRRSAPTADGADGRKFSDTFYHFNAPYEMKRGYLTATLESQFLHCASISP